MKAVGSSDFLQLQPPFMVVYMPLSLANSTGGKLSGTELKSGREESL